MAERMSYELTLRTSATGTGARDTAVAMNAVATSTARVADGAARFLTAAEAEVQKVMQLVATAQKLAAEKDRLASKAPSVEGFLRRTATEARVSEVAFYDLSREIARTANTSESLAAAAARAGGGTKNIGLIAQQAGYQVQDFTVQVAAGTSAFTAFAQQAPQFLGIFGPGGAMAGALVAVGAVAARMFFGMGEGAKEAKKQQEFLIESLKQTGENIAEIKIEDIEQRSQAINAAAEAQSRLARGFPEIAKAQSDYSLAAIENGQTQIETEAAINELLGLRVDKFRELRQLQGLEEKKGEEVAQQAIASERAALKEAEIKAAEAARIAAGEAESLADQKAELEKRRQELGAARNVRDPLEKTAKQKMGALALSPRDGDGLFPWSPTREATDAKKQLDGKGGVLAKITILEKQIKTLEDQVERVDAPLVEKVKAANMALVVANQDLFSAQSVTATNIDRIQKTLETSQLSEKAKIAAEQGELLAKEVTEAATKIDTSTESGKAAKERLLKAAEDGKITLQEIQQLGADLVTIGGLIQTGQATTSANQQMIISLLTALRNENENFKKQLQDLQK